jgi:hypothetical protein
MTEAELIKWLKNESAIRCVLMEVGVLVDGVETTRYLSNKGYVTGPLDTPANTIYSPAISGGVSFTESLSLEGEPSLSYGDIELTNVQGDRDSWLNDVWTNRSVQVYIGDATWARSDFYKVFDGVVAGINSRARNKINLKISDTMQRLNTPLSEKKLGGTATNKDSLLPLCFGECHNVTPLISDPANHEYQVHDGAIEDIIEVRDNGVPVNFTKYLATGKFRLSQSPVGTITCSVQGAKIADGVGSELVKNGTFESSLDGWTMIKSFGGSMSLVGNKIRVTSDGTWWPCAQTTVPTEVGKEYVLSCAFGAYSGENGLHVGTGATEELKYSIAANVRAFPFKFVATSTSTYIGVETGKAAGSWAEYDDISVKPSAGVNLVTNGDMSSATGWSLDAGCSIANGVLSFNGTLATSYADQTKLTVGKSYDITFTLSNYVAGTVDITTNGGLWTTGMKNVNGTYTASLHSCHGTTLYVRGSSNFKGDIDNLIVRESNNLVMNSGFDKDTNSWSNNSGTIAATGGRLQITSASAGAVIASQPVALTVGRVYQATGSWTDTSGAGVSLNVMATQYGSTIISQNAAGAAGQNGTFSFIFTASQANVWFGPRISNATASGQTATFDNIALSDVTELVSNGTFEGSLSNWTLSTVNGTISTSANKLVMTKALSGSNTSMSQAFPTIVGAKYKVSYDASALSGAYQIQCGPYDSGYISTVGNGQSFTFTATSASTTLNVVLGGGGSNSITFDNLSVKLLMYAGGYTNNVATLVKHICTTYGNTSRFTENDLDTVSLNAFEAANTQPVGIYLSDRANVLEVCNNLAKSVGARAAMNRQGQMYLVKLDLSNLVGGGIITASLMVDKSLQVSDLPAVKAGTKVGYCKNWTVQTGLTTGLPEAHISMYAEEWLSSTVTDAGVASTYRLHTEPTLEETMLLVEADAIAEATRRLNMFKVQRKVMRYESFGDLLFEKLGNVQTLQHERFGLSAGKAGQIISIETNWLNPHTTLEVLI